jgi:molybdopterin-containing oxidoreductase family molybdopterin binding subunit
MKTDTERKERTVCDPNCHADPKCGLIATIREGRITEVKGANYPVPGFDGRICLMGRSRLEYQYHPDRLKRPLKRVGERGEGKWEEISWSEAADIFSKEHKRIADKYGPKSVAFTSVSGAFALLTRASPMRYAALTGATMNRPSGIDFGIPKGLEKMFGIPATSYFSPGGHCFSDSSNSDLILIWGGNPAVTRSVDHSYLKRARQTGTKLFCIDPVKSETAKLCNQWESIRPGTDGALALGLIHQILAHDLQDTEFLLAYTDMACLVNSETGEKLKHKDIFEHGSGECMVWCAETGIPVPNGTAIQSDLNYCDNITLLNGEICRVQTVFNLLTELASQYPSGVVQRITGISRETVETLARQYAQAKPASIRIGYGVDRWYYSDVTARAIATLACITGNIGVPGGGVSLVAGSKSAAVRARTFYAPDGKMPNFLSLMEMDSAVRESVPYKIRMECITLGNPFNQVKPNRQKVLDEYVSALEFITVIDHFMTDTAKQADLVLPACTIFERTDIVVDRFIQLQQRMVEPEGESKSDFEIFALFAEKMGFGSYFERTPEDYIGDMLDTGDEETQLPTLDRLLEEKVVFPWEDTKPYVGFSDRVFPTNSGRIHFYSEELLPYGSELPVYREPIEASHKNPLFEKYPFVLLSSHSRYRIHSTFANLEMTKVREPEPVARIHPEDAQRGNIDDGEVIRVYNDRGHLLIKCRFDGDIRPGCVLVREGHWIDQFIEGDPYILTHDKFSETAENYAHYDVLVDISAT